MSAAITAAVIVAGAGVYEAQQQKKAAANAAKVASQPTTETTVRDPWAPSMTARTGILDRVNNLLASGAKAPAPAPTGAKPAGSSTPARRLTRAQWLAANPGKTLGSGASGGTAGAAAKPASTAPPDYNATLKDFLSGKYLGPNPNTDAMIASLGTDLQDQFNRTYAANDLAAEAGGRLGGSGANFRQAVAQGEMEKALAGADANLRYTDYSNELDNMLKALGIGTGYDVGLKGVAAQIKGINAQAAAARASNSVARGYLANANAMLPYNQLGALTGVVGGISDGYGTTTTNASRPVAPAPTPSVAGAAIRGGLAGYQWGSQLGQQYGWGQPAPTIQPQPIQPIPVAPTYYQP